MAQTRIPLRGSAYGFTRQSCMRLVMRTGATRILPYNFKSGKYLRDPMRDLFAEFFKKREFTAPRAAP